MRFSTPLRLERAAPQNRSHVALPITSEHLSAINQKADRNATLEMIASAWRVAAVSVRRDDLVQNDRSAVLLPASKAAVRYLRHLNE